ncbi:MAG: DUF2283 domain-containing protein [Dehalococcoidia bacterium]|nr:DUF2283 domain-containing protein [Dehalococcoidia bacterium]
MYIRVSEAQFDHTTILDDHRYLDFGKDGTLIGIEILYPSLGVSVVGLPPSEAAMGRLLKQHGFKLLAPNPK